ncbi:MAG: response regulator transcription factor [Clostridia bacterium]|nr:response regulator transcription factor [Clostridia bacterium]
MDFISDYKPIYDVVLMDIEMPMMNGMETARKLREKGDKAPLIFITNMQQYAVNGYEVDAIGFMLKPVTYFSFALKLKKAVLTVMGSKNNFIALTFKDGIKKIYIEDIYYVEVYKHRLLWHLTDDVFEANGTMKDVENMLAGKDFARCNHCWLVNLEHVRQVKKESVFVGEDELLISRNKRKEFMDALTRFLTGGGRL